MESLDMYRVWRVCPHFDRVAEFRELWPRDDVRMHSAMVFTAEAMLAGEVSIPARLVENCYGGDAPLSAGVLRRTLEYIVASELTTAPSPELLTAWLVDGVLRWHPTKSLPAHMERRVTPDEVVRCAAECDRPQVWPGQLQPRAEYPEHEVATLRKAVTARKIERFLRDTRMKPEVQRLLQTIPAM